MLAIATTPLPPDLESWIGLTEMGKSLGINPHSVRRLIKRGEIDGVVLFGGKYLIQEEKLDEFKERGYNSRPGRKPIRRLL